MGTDKRLRPLWPIAVCYVAIAGFAGVVTAGELASGVRGLATRAPAAVKIDGDLAEFKEAFATPVCYFEQDVANRAALFFYMWDDEAFYAALRTCDKKQANNAPDNQLWEGDGVEWYFDTRRDGNFRARTWGPGAVHMYWTALKGSEIKARWCLRPDMLQAIAGTGVEVAGKRTSFGNDVEFKLPWANFPNFKPKLDAVIALDAELCYSDGGPRTYRTFAYGSPLSVQQPASQAKVQLVEKLEPRHWKQCAAVMMPVRCDTAWDQPTLPHVTGLVALPPNHADQIGQVVFRVTDTSGKTLGDFPAQTEVIESAGQFSRGRATWPTELAVPGAHHLVAIAYDKQGEELARVAPRLVSVNMTPGY